MKILLIDDDKDDQVIFMEAVRQLTDEIQCETADDGRQGLCYLHSIDILPDVLFLDINMPLMDGKETLRAIRANPKLDTIAVVIYSTSNLQSDIAWASASNARYLVKPNNFHSLLATLSRTLCDTLMMEKNQNLILQAC